jgi:putrescine aminotransferase
VTSTVERYARHIDPAFTKLLGVLGYGRVYARAEDVYVWDEQGRRYLDLLAGFGSVNIGHNHPRLVARLQEFLGARALNLSHTGPSAHAAALAEQLARAAGGPLDISLFSTSGAEAVEAAMKLARAATGRQRVVACDNGYHGLSLGTLSLSSSARMRAPFEPLLERCTIVPFGNAGALERELSAGDVAAFIVEPVQIEGGVRFAPDGYLQAVRSLCTRHGTLLVLDEVQTGFGRLGSLFAFHQESIVPDVLVLGKAAGGAMAAMAITMTTAAIQRKAYGSMRRFDLHGSTFAGNAFACAAALETLQIIEDERLCANCRERGDELLAGLRQRLNGHPFVRDIRGRGLLIAIELQAGVEKLAEVLAGQWLSVVLLERGVIVQPASQAWNVLRIEPPLTLTREHVRESIAAIGAAFDEHRSMIPLLARATWRIGAQLVSGGAFR